MDGYVRKGTGGEGRGLLHSGIRRMMVVVVCAGGGGNSACGSWVVVCMCICDVVWM